jgi:hypothetical protein
VPTVETVTHIDASKGLDAKASADIRIIFSGIYATSMRATLARTPRADMERNFRQRYSSPGSGIEIDQVSWSDDPAKDLFTVDLQGAYDMDWRKNQDLGVREFKVGSGIAPPAFPRRDPGPNDTAPFAIPYPAYTRNRVEIALPDGGKGYTVRGASGTEHVAGYEITSSAAIQGGLATFTSDQRAVTPEISAADAESANLQIRKLRDVDNLVRAPT